MRTSWRCEGFCGPSGRYLQKISRQNILQYGKYFLTVNDQRRPVKEETGDFVRMGSKFLTSKQAVEYQPRVGQSTRLDGQRKDGASVWSIRSSQPWQGRVVVRAICRSVGVFVSHVPNFALAN